MSPNKPLLLQLLQLIITNQNSAAAAITAPRPLASNTIAAYEKFYNLVLDYCAQKGGLLASEGPGRTEARVALESVFPVASLAYFLTLTQQEKAQQVDELTRVTVGICLYHQSSGAASSVLPAGASTCLQQGRRLLRELEGRVQLLEQSVRVAQGAAAAGVAGEQAEEAIATLTYTCQVQWEWMKGMHLSLHVVVPLSGHSGSVSEWLRKHGSNCVAVVRPK